MKIITVALPTKGGVGKTTTALNIAVELSKKHCVKYYDLDKSMQSTKFNLVRKNKLDMEIVKDQEQLKQSLEKAKCDFVIIDSGGYEDDLNTMAMYYADTIIIPTTDSGFDIPEVLDFAQTIKENIFVEDNGYTEVKILVNRVHFKNNSFHRDIKEEFESMPRFSVFNTIVAENKVYKTMRDLGLGVSEIAKNERATNDSINLALEVEGC